MSLPSEAAFPPIGIPIDRLAVENLDVVAIHNTPHHVLPDARDDLDTVAGNVFFCQPLKVALATVTVIFFLTFLNLVVVVRDVVGVVLAEQSLRAEEEEEEESL